MPRVSESIRVVAPQLSPTPPIPVIDTTTPTPRMTVVIPTRNRAAALVACLNSLAKQTEAPSLFEVIVVDDASADSTRQAVTRLQMPYALRYYYQEQNGGPGAARNRGAEEATGTVLLFLDDDMTADPRLVAEHLQLHDAHQRVVGVGRSTLKLRGRPNPFARQLVRSRADRYERLDTGLPPSFMDCYSGNLSIGRETFLNVGGFATDLRRDEDIELGFRLQAAGARIVYLRHAVAMEDRPLTFRKIARDAEMEGAADVVVWRRHPAALTGMKLGSFECARLREVILRKILLSLRLPVNWLGLFTPLVARGRMARAWYRFICTYAYWRGVRRALGRGDMWNRLTSGTLILMYHAIGSGSEPGTQYVVPSERFARQLWWIKRRGYPVIGLNTLLAERREHRLPPAGSIVLTFDDGYQDTLTLARPRLAQHGFPATVFLVTGLAGMKNLWDRENALAGRPLLSWESVRGAAGDGISFGAHTRNHVSLPPLTQVNARDEVAGSREDLQRELGRPPDVFAYPYGQDGPTVRAIVSEAGFSAACGVRAGRNCASTDEFDLRRLLIDGRWGAFRFALAITLGVDPFARRRG
jgi:glycosyltransferase involved in cell wall biosynthesis/peptidoglycan/xylan/chitin deacetylase (PgdA/CDA1 family)